MEGMRDIIQYWTYKAATIIRCDLLEDKDEIIGILSGVN